MSLLEQDITRKRQVDENTTQLEMDTGNEKEYKDKEFEITQSVPGNQMTIHQRSTSSIYRNVALMKKRPGSWLWLYKTSQN